MDGGWVGSLPKLWPLGREMLVPHGAEIESSLDLTLSIGS